MLLGLSIEQYLRLIKPTSLTPHKIRDPTSKPIPTSINGRAYATRSLQHPFIHYVTFNPLQGHGGVGPRTIHHVAHFIYTIYETVHYTEEEKPVLRLS